MVEPHIFERVIDLSFHRPHTHHVHIYVQLCLGRAAKEKLSYLHNHNFTGQRARALAEMYRCDVRFRERSV